MQGLCRRKSVNMEGQINDFSPVQPANYFRRLPGSFPQISHVLLGDLRFSGLLHRSVRELDGHRCEVSLISDQVRFLQWPARF